MEKHIEGTINNIEEDITSQIPPKYLDNYLKTLNGNASKNGELEISGGWDNICKFAYRKCPGARDKEVFNSYCVSNRRLNIENIFLSMKKNIFLSMKKNIFLSMKKLVQDSIKEK